MSRLQKALHARCCADPPVATGRGGEAKVHFRFGALPTDKRGGGNDRYQLKMPLGEPRLALNERRVRK